MTMPELMTGITGLLLIGGVVVVFVTVLLAEHRLSRIQYRAQDMKAMLERMEKNLFYLAEVARHQAQARHEAEKQQPPVEIAAS